MVSLIAGALTALGLPAGPAWNAPDVPSAPVEIGTSGTRQHVSEAGSWQVLLVMFVLALVLGAVVLMYAVRQRARLVARRRVRRMGDVAAWVAALEDAGGPAAATVTPTATRSEPGTPPRPTPATPDRPPPTA